MSGNQLAITAGVDFPWIGYQYLVESKLADEHNKAFGTGVKYVNEEWDVKAYLTLRRSGGLTFGHWLRSIYGTKAWAIGAWDDPLPLIIVIWRFLRAFCCDLWLTTDRATNG